MAIGFFCHYGVGYFVGLAEKGLNMPDTSALYLDGGSVWLLMAVILFVIAQVMN